jgi:hypothetical protein
MSSPMNRFYGIVFAIGVSAFLLFAGSATLGSLEDFGLQLTDPTRSRLEQIFSWAAGVFVLCGFVMLLEAIHFVRTSWPRLSPFGRFVGTFGLLMTTILGGYIYHFFFVSLARSDRSSEQHGGA